MGKIFYLFGKSATGKDKFYQALMSKEALGLEKVVPYTTRPMRVGERNGVQYFFIDDAEAKSLEEEGKIIEMRAYQTVYGVWKYMTVSGNIDLKKHNYLMLGTLESYLNTREYFGKDQLVPLYIYVEDGERLARALKRERKQSEPKYAEMCRRFLADEEDYKPEKLAAGGIGPEDSYENVVFDECLQELIETIEKHL